MDEVSLTKMDEISLSREETGDCIIKIDGKTFRCECGCNVFRRIGELRYECNSCRATFTGEK